MKRMFAVLNSLALMTMATFVTSAATGQTTTTSTIIGALEGPRTAIFSSPENSCNANDVPDAMPRAFRDYTGTIHFSSASSELFQSLGPTLETLEHSCDRAFKSANDPNPAHYNDEEWLDAFFTLDGKNIAVLAHTEYHGWAIQGECNVQGDNQYSACEYDSDTFHLSNDGGYHFTTPLPPGNFVAGIPYQYQVDDGPASYSVDSNIVQLGDWYYAIVTDYAWPPNCTGSSGSNPCLVPHGGAPLRTQNVFDPTSWRTWSGHDFSVSFADPYVGTVSNPEEHVFAPVPYMVYINGIYLYKSTNLVVATLWDYWDGALGVPGLYLTTSTDFIHWTKPTLVVTRNDLMANDPKGNFLYVYFSLIDPNAPDLNFSVIGDEPYLYFVRLDNNNSSKRVLYRQRVKLTLNP